MNEVLKAISAAPKIIAELENKNLTIKQQLSEIKEAMDGIRKSTWAEVAAEKDENGKKVFPNAELRDIEVERRLSENERYHKCDINLKVFEDTKVRNEIELQQITNQFSVDRYKIRLYTAEKIERAAGSFCQGVSALHHLGAIIAAFKPNNSMQEDCPF